MFQPCRKTPWSGADLTWAGRRLLGTLDATDSGRLSESLPALTVQESRNPSNFTGSRGPFEKWMVLECRSKRRLRERAPISHTADVKRAGGFPVEHDRYSSSRGES
jgi:hypothetical protein